MEIVQKLKWKLGLPRDVHGLGAKIGEINARVKNQIHTCIGRMRVYGQPGLA